MHAEQAGGFHRRAAFVVYQAARKGDLRGGEGRGRPKRTPRSRAASRPMRVRSTIKPGHGHNVAGAQVIEHSRQFRPLAVSAGDLLRVDFGAAGRRQLGPLIGQVLRVDADAGVADMRSTSGVAKFSLF